jgi:hypothetical protein
VDEFKELDLGFTPDSGVPNPVLLQTDYSAALIFGAREKLSDGKSSEVVGNAVIQFEHCRLTKFGYPNDEAADGIPRFKGLTYGAYEVLESSWIDEVIQLNKYSFPDTPWFVNTRHFVFVFHDSTFECLAGDMQTEFNHELWEQLWVRVYQRVLRYAGA